MAWNAWKRRCKKVDSQGENYTSIHDRFLRDPFLSQLAIGWSEQKCKECDELAKEDHTKTLIPEEKRRYKGRWYLTLNKERKNGPVKLRSDFRAAVLLKNRVHHESRERIERRLHPDQQRKRMFGQLPNWFLKLAPLLNYKWQLGSTSLLIETRLDMTFKVECARLTHQVMLLTVLRRNMSWSSLVPSNYYPCEHPVGTIACHWHTPASGHQCCRAISDKKTLCFSCPVFKYFPWLWKFVNNRKLVLIVVTAIFVYMNRVIRGVFLSVSQQ